MSIYCTEQLPVPGVPIPDIDNQKLISWGIVDGTKIGYIYVFSWSRENPSEKFYNAVDSLMHVYETNGLILDFRCNGGGYISTCFRGFDLLFDSEITSIKLARRIDPGNHFEMKDCGTFQLHPNPETFYDKPIAVLTGPGTFSATNFIALWLKFHPHTRFFGKSTASAYSSPTELKLDAKGWHILYSWANGYLGDFPDQFLTHVELEVDEPIWLTPDDVYRGKDSVVEAAIAWIKSVTEIEDDHDRKIPYVVTLSQNYPNPFNSSTTIIYKIGKISDVELKIYNMLGKEVATMISKQLPPGEYKHN
jgi:C-terminal processing protease CtpA/Prc